MRHLDEGTIHAWLDGALPADEAEYVAKHSAECAECAAAVADARGLIAGASRIVSSLDVVRGNVIPLQPKPAPGAGSLWRMLHLTPARAAIAATLLLAVGSTFVLTHSAEEMKVADTTAATIAAMAPAPAATVRETAEVVRRSAKRAEHQEPRTQPAPVAVATATPPAPKADSISGVAQPRAPVVAEKATADRAAGLNAAQVAMDARREFLQSSAGAGAQRLAQATGPLSVEGCYRLFLDSTSWLRVIPERFSLERDSTSGASVVRSVSASGRLDSLVAGGRWRPVPTSSALVVFVPQPSRPVTVQFSAASSRARVSSAEGQTKDVGVERTSCRP